METHINPTLVQLERLAAAEQALQLIGSAALALVVLGVCLAVWDKITRSLDP